MPTSVAWSASSGIEARDHHWRLQWCQPARPPDRVDGGGVLAAWDRFVQASEAERSAVALVDAALAQLSGVDEEELAGDESDMRRAARCCAANGRY